jgi:hypothetical protein
MTSYQREVRELVVRALDALWRLHNDDDGEQDLPDVSGLIEELEEWRFKRGV